MLRFGQQHAHLADSFVASKPAVVSGAAGAVAAVTPTERLATVTGEWLTTHGIGAISYTELIQVIGAVWVLCLIADRVWAGFKMLRRK